jgi:hypothetical protein
MPEQMGPVAKGRVAVVTGRTQACTRCRDTRNPSATSVAGTLPRPPAQPGNAARQPATPPVANPGLPHHAARKRHATAMPSHRHL